MHSVVWQGECSSSDQREHVKISRDQGPRVVSRRRQGFGRELLRKKNKASMRPFYYDDLESVLRVDGGKTKHIPPTKSAPSEHSSSADRPVTRRVISGAAREIGSEGPGKEVEPLVSGHWTGKRGPRRRKRKHASTHARQRPRAEGAAPRSRQRDKRLSVEKKRGLISIRDVCIFFILLLRSVNATSPLLRRTMMTGRICR